jgi:3-deoxy-manno-octulosonate cytidylyltransferase (CMP-KDO synthetase)
VTAAGGEAVLTDPDLPSGTDRIFQALGRIDPERRYARVVNVQGDLPVLEPGALRRVVEPLDLLGTDMATLACPPRTRRSGRTRTWSRRWSPSRPTTRARPAPLLHPGDRTLRPRPGLPPHRHLRLHPRRAGAVRGLPPSPLERRERLEQLRALENGMSIGVRLVEAVPFGVDTPEDLERARRILEGGA